MAMAPAIKVSVRFGPERWLSGEVSQGTALRDLHKFLFIPGDLPRVANFQDFSWTEGSDSSRQLRDGDRLFFTRDHPIWVNKTRREREEVHLPVFGLSLTHLPRVASILIREKLLASVIVNGVHASLKQKGLYTIQDCNWYGVFSAAGHSLQGEPWLRRR